MTQSNTPLKSRRLTCLRWPLALSILAWLMHSHRDGFMRIAGQSPLWHWVALAIALRAAALLLGCLRWRHLLTAQQIPFPLRSALRLGCLGNLCNYVVPGTVGGDLTKAVMAARENPQGRSVVAATVILDRVVGMLGLLLLGTAAAAAHPALWARPELATAMLLFVAGSMAGLLGLSVLLHPAAVRCWPVRQTVRIPKIGWLCAEMIRAVTLYQTRRHVLGAALGMSIIGHAANVSAVWCCAAALQLEDAAPAYSSHLLVVPMAEISAAVLPLPGGIGAREGALQYLYSVTGGSSASGTLPALAHGEAGLYTAVGFSLVSIVVALLGGVLALVCRPERSPGAILPATGRVCPVPAG